MVLGLFFSRGVSLQLWVDRGLFDREKLIYEQYLQDSFFSKIYWFTYGDGDKELSLILKKQNQLHRDIEVVPMPNIFKVPKIGSYIYSLILPFIKKSYLLNCDIYKTNQTDGSWSAVIAKKIYKKKLLYRTGFALSQLENNLKRFNFFIRFVIEFVEKIAYKNCDKAIVSSNHNYAYIIEKYQIEKDKLSVIYNFIDRDIFYDYEIDRSNKIIFVGRLSDEKNIFNLIKASNNVGVALDIYGSGKLETKLKQFIDKYKYRVELKGNALNSHLPKILNSYKYFALVSKHEGMPKALIEAMACGCICIGTDVSGINEVIKKDKTGVLSSDISVDSVTKALEKMINLSPNKIDNMKAKSREYIDDYFVLPSIIQKEKNLIYEMINAK